MWQKSIFPDTLFVTAGFLAGVFLFIFTLLNQNKMETMRIWALVDYLEQELFKETGTSIDIQELGGEMAVAADLEWIMEAVISLMKNCMEHNVGGTIHCSYKQNPLYTQILIWDEGDGSINHQ